MWSTFLNILAIIGVVVVGAIIVYLVAHLIITGLGKNSKTENKSKDKGSKEKTVRPTVLETNELDEEYVNEQNNQQNPSWNEQKAAEEKTKIDYNVNNLQSQTVEENKKTEANFDEFDDIFSDTNEPAVNEVSDKELEKIIEKVNTESVAEYNALYKKEEKPVVVEKPKQEEAPSNIAGLGRYIVKPEIFDVLEKLSKGAGGEYQFTDAMKELMKEQDFYACIMDATYYDTGSKLGYLKATIDYALEREDLKEPLKEYLKERIEK